MYARDNNIMTTSTCMWKRKCALLIAVIYTGTMIALTPFYSSFSLPFTIHNPVSSLLSVERNSPSYEVHSEWANRGFVTALRYSGQQASGIKALQSLQCWAGTLSVPMSILEPAIPGSAIVSSLKFQDQLMFSDFFDIDHFNSFARKNSLAELAQKEEFFQNAPRKIILVQMDLVRRSTPENQRHTEVLWPADSNSNSQRCFRLQDHIKANLSEIFIEVPELLGKGYCVVKVVSSPHSTARKEIFSQSDVTNTIYGAWRPSQVTVVFSLWRAIWEVHRASIPSVSSCNTTNPFLPSPRIEQDVETYENQFLGHKNTLTIMFRLERMVVYLSGHHKIKDDSMIIRKVDKCLSTLVNTVQSIQNKQTHFTKPFITLDLGVFGSTSWNKSLSNIGHSLTQQLLTTKVNKILSPFFKNEWSFKEWESSFTKVTGGISNSGYIAALQRTLASRAECLVLVGGGDFQEIALRDYFQRHPDKGSKCVHLVCVIHENILRNMILN